MLVESVTTLYGVAVLTIVLVLISPASRIMQINSTSTEFAIELTVNSSAITSNVEYLCAGDLFGVGLSLQSCADENCKMESSPSVRT